MEPAGTPEGVRTAPWADGSWQHELAGSHSPVRRWSGMSTLYVAAVLAIVALAASMFSVEFGLSVAIIEIVAGAVIGNTLHLATPDWLVFLAGFGSVVLTFLAGAEVDPGYLRATLK